jgi:hypothetical protein
VKVSLLDALTVISLRVRQAKQALFEKGARSSQQASHSAVSGSTWPYSFSFQNANAMFW